MIIKYIFWTVWRIWFYILILLPILVFAPLLILLLLKDNWYPYFFKIARIWAKIILVGMGFYSKVEQLEQFEKNKSYMLVSNHTSMTDVMLMLAIVPNNPFVFVGKAELAKFPVFGYFYKRCCILVDRASSKSRFAVFAQAENKIKQGLSICIFPEGGVPDDESIVLDAFKDGAFRLAIEHQIPIVPMTFFDNKERFSFTFFSGSIGKMRVKIHPFIPTQGLTIEDKNQIKNKVYKLLLNDLESDIKK
jgi:1-acyl-sn-glycerol-3-phosphate acyltransferase